MACTGVRTATNPRLARPTVRGCTCVPCFFCARQVRKETVHSKPQVPCYGPTLTKTDTMLHCITPTDGRCGRIVCRHPPLTKHRNKNSINVKLTKTGTGCLRCTPPCSGVRRQAMMGVPLQAMIHGAWASIRPTAEPEPERFADYNFVRGAPFCCRSGFLTEP